MYHAQATVHGSRCQPPFSAGPLDRPVPVDESQRVFVEDGSPESDWIRLVIKKDRFPESDQSVRTLFFHPPPQFITTGMGRFGGPMPVPPRPTVLGVRFGFPPTT